jgi:thioredoxin 1
MSSKVVTLTAESFDTLALTADRAVVDFWAAWCPPCRALAPAVEALAEERPDVLVGKLDVDAHPEIAERYGIVSIPTVLAFRSGELAARSVGLVPVARLRDLVPDGEEKAMATTTA